MWNSLFILCLFIVASSSFSMEIAPSCRACHAERNEERECVRCHSSSLQPRSGRSVTGLYANAPQFNSHKMEKLKPFDLKGLSAYLQNPITRRRMFGGMYGMSEPMSKLTSSSFEQWSSPSTFQPQAELAPEGQRIFMAKTCHQCHGPQAKAALLPIGYPLYNFQYFAKLLAGASTYYKSDKAKTMPLYIDLTSSEVQALYSYVSLMRPQSIEELSDSAGASRSGDLLYQDVTQIFRRNGCLHCHGAGESSVLATGNLFAGTPEKFRLLYANDQVEVIPSAALSEKDASGMPRLLSVLEARRAEWQGKTQGKARGMPLSLPPLKASEIYILKLWLKAGCPSPKSKLCT